jgi:peptidoglycan/LPS O-acetylase OafA/YrhL
LRSKYWDGWKGICIIAVITGHSFPVLDKIPAGSLSWSLEVLLYQINLFPVFIFFALAGYFSLPHTSGKQVKDVASYYKHRLGRILPPYLLWTAAYILLEHRGHLSSVRDLLKDVLLGTGIYIGYFVIVLVQFILITPILANLNNRRMHLVLMSALFAGSLVLIYILRVGYSQSWMAQYPYVSLPCLLWYPFYHLGLFMAKYNVIGNEALRRFSFCFLGLYLFFLAASMAEGYIFTRGGYALGMSQLKATTLLAGLFLVLFLFSSDHGGFDQIFEKDWIQFLGHHSYVIYLTHLLFLPRIQSLIYKIPFFDANRLLNVPPSSILTLMLCVILIRLIQKMLPNNYRLLGV